MFAADGERAGWRNRPRCRLAERYDPVLSDARAGRSARRPIALTKALACGPSGNVFRNIRILVQWLFAIRDPAMIVPVRNPPTHPSRRWRARRRFRHGETRA